MEEFQNQTNIKSDKKFSLKNILLIVIPVIVLVIILLSSIFFMIGRKTNNTQDLGLIFDENKLIPVKIDNLYGYISPKNGKIVIKPTFQTAGAFYGNYASVSYKENDSTKYGIIDKTGKVKLSSNYNSDIQNILEYGLVLVNNKLYNKNLKPITDDLTNVSYDNNGYSHYTKYNATGKIAEFGILNKDGKKVYTYKVKNSETSFDCSIHDAHESLGEIYAVTNIDNKYGIVNLASGKLVYNYTDNYISAEGDNIFEISNSNNNSKTVICIVKNKIVYEINDNVDVSYYDYSKKILEIYNSSAKSSEKYTYYDISKKSTLSEKPQRPSDNSLASLIGYSSFSTNGKYGIMKKEKVILSCDYKSIDFLSPTTFNYIKNKKHQELVFARRDDEMQLINLKNKKILKTFNTTSIKDYSTSTFVTGQMDNSKEKFVYNMLTGKMETFDSNAKITVYSNYVTVSTNNTLAYYNSNLKNIYTDNNNK